MTVDSVCKAALIESRIFVATHARDDRSRVLPVVIAIHVGQRLGENFEMLTGHSHATNSLVAGLMNDRGSYRQLGLYDFAGLETGETGEACISQNERNQDQGSAHFIYSVSAVKSVSLIKILDLAESLSNKITRNFIAYFVSGDSRISMAYFLNNAVTTLFISWNSEYASL